MKRGPVLLILLLLASTAFAQAVDVQIQVEQVNGKTWTIDEKIRFDSTQTVRQIQLLPPKATTDVELVSKPDGKGLFEAKADGVAPSVAQTSEGKECMQVKPTGNNRFQITYDPLCQACGTDMQARIRYGTGGPSSTVVIPLDVSCQADVLIVTRAGLDEDGKKRLKKDARYADSLRQYMEALAHETPQPLSSRYVELDHAMARVTFGVDNKAFEAIAKPRGREKTDAYYERFYAQTNEANGLVAQLDKVQAVVFGLPESRTSMKYLLLLGGLTQMPMPGFPFPRSNLYNNNNRGFVPSDELYGRGMTFTAAEVEKIHSDRKQWFDTYKSAVNRLENQKLTVAVGRIPIATEERSTKLISEKLEQYTRTRLMSTQMKEIKKTLLVVDRCGGSDCFINSEFVRTGFAHDEKAQCDEETCGPIKAQYSPPYCSYHVGKAVATCRPFVLFKEIKNADALYFYTHGSRGLFLSETKDRNSFTVLTASDVVDNLDLHSKEPVVFTDSCYAAALDLAPEDPELKNKAKTPEELQKTWNKRAMPLALLSKGAMMYFGSTRAVPSYEEAYYQNKVKKEPLYSPIDKFVRLTSANRKNEVIRVGDAMVKVKEEAIKRAKEPGDKIAFFAFQLYGDPTLRIFRTGNVKLKTTPDGTPIPWSNAEIQSGPGCTEPREAPWQGPKMAAQDAPRKS